MAHRAGRPLTPWLPVASNRTGFGSIVRLEVDGKTYSQLYNGKSGYLSQSAPEVVFAGGVVKAVRVRWADGVEEDVEAREAGRTHVLVRD